MSKHARLLFFAAGAAVFAFLIYQVGPGVLLENLQRTGWTLVPVILSWIPVFLCWAAAWRLTMHGAPDLPPYWRLVSLSMSGLAVNLVTPLAQVGGEAFKIGAVSPWLGPQRATSSIVTFYMLHAMTNMLVWLLGIALVFTAFHPPGALGLPLAAIGVVIGCLMVFVFARIRQGIIRPLVNLVRALPLVGKRLQQRFDAQQARIDELDVLITGFYRASPPRFWLAFALDFTGRTLAFAEYWLIARGIGLEMSVVQTFVIGSLAALVINVIFFMPMEAGTKEGGLYYAFRTVGLDPGLGVFAAIVQRLRELTWIAIGLILIWAAGDRQLTGVKK